MVFIIVVVVNVGKRLERNVMRKIKPLFLINKKWVDDLKNKSKCVKCGENHPACLDFHHRDPEMKDNTISYLVAGTYSLDIIKKEIEKCDILCSNCHRKHHYDEITNRLLLESLIQIKKKDESVKRLPSDKTIKNAKKMGDTFGGINKLTDEEIKRRFDSILSVNLLTYGWVKKVSDILKISHTQTRRFIDKYYEGDIYRR
jgi:hypothetical protein